jgi:hypothetical protein
LQRRAAALATACTHSFILFSTLLLVKTVFGRVQRGTLVPCADGLVIRVRNNVILTHVLVVPTGADVCTLIENVKTNESDKPLDEIKILSVDVE